MNPKNVWNEEEINYIKNNYSKISLLNLNLLIPNRTISAIKNKVYRLELKKPEEAIKKIRREFMLKLNLENNPMKNLKSRNKAVLSNRLNGNYKKNSERMKINNPTKNGLSEEWRRKIGIDSKKKYYENPKIRERLKEWAIRKLKGKINPTLTILSKNKNFQKKRSLGLKQKPNKPEKILIEIIEKYNLNFIYVGDGKIWFNGENNIFNPDFINQEKKLIIEVFGNYWHNLPKKKLLDIERLKTYKNLNYKTLIIWEEELVDRFNKKLSEGEIVNKILNF